MNSKWRPDADVRLLVRGVCGRRAPLGEVDALIAEGIRRNVWRGIRTVSRSKRPWTLCRQRPKMMMLGV